MAETSYEPATAMLDYYRAHGISPVRYDLSDLDAHLDRRDFLYRSVGLPPAAFRGCAVLEVAAGSGQNSLYVASCGPASYDLVEPNPAGIRDIQAAYAGFERPHTTPRLITEQFENFVADRSYDIVICENWLSGAPSETALLGKLAGLLNPGGVLVVTVVPYSGFAPNVMRHILAHRLLDQRGALSFEEKSEYLVGVFGRHLATMAAMTRSHEDWVRDCLLNTAYLPVALPLRLVIDSIGPEMESLSFSPNFSVDWRWFKTGAGDARCLNALASNNYLANLHNFIDWRKMAPPRAADENLDLDLGFQLLHAAATAWLDAKSEATKALVSEALGDVVRRLKALDADLSAAFAEVLEVWRKPVIDEAEVRDLPRFGPLFGRELIYASFTRKR